MFGKLKKINKPNHKDKKRSQLSTIQMEERENYLKGVMAKTKIPLVVVDTSWYQVKELLKNKMILQKENKLLEEIKEQGNLTNQLKQDAQVKKNLMQEVLEVSQKLDENANGKESKALEKLQQGIVKLTEEMKTKEERLDTLSEEIEAINKDLVGDAVILGYEYMQNYREKSQELEDSINELREKVLAQTAEKKQCDEQIAILYHYLHNIVGYQHIDKVDKLLGEEKNG